jgi:hypothetical protein
MARYSQFEFGRPRSMSDLQVLRALRDLSAEPSAAEGVTAEDVAHHLGRTIRSVTVSLNRWAPIGGLRGQTVPEDRDRFAAE